MSRLPLAVLFGGALALAIVLCALTGCGRGRDRSSESPSAPPAAPVAGTAEHVYGPGGPPAASATRIALRPQPPPFADPRLIALAEARAVCTFDWHQTLAARIEQARAYATPAYQQALAPSPADEANWQRTQRDRESASCAVAGSFLVTNAPNTPTVRFERVEMAQRVSVGSRSPTSQPFAALYRIERQPDGRWLVGADGEGG